MECYQNLASTNARARKWLCDAPEGTVIIVEEQSRDGADWGGTGSSRRKVCMSVILKPRLSPKKPRG